MFSELHQSSYPLLLANVWDIPSAKAAAAAGYQALGTSSAAIAAAMGYVDGQNLPFAHLLTIVKRIRQYVSLPLSVDLEAGYGSTPAAIADNILQLHAIGVVGINLEDSLENGVRKLRDPEVFAAELQTIMATVRPVAPDLFFNIRTDTYLLGSNNPLAESLLRIKQYEKAGANGIFLPGITLPAAIRQVVTTTSLPLNVMCMPDLPDFQTLASLGVKRISMGNFLQVKLQQRLTELFQTITEQQNFSALCS